MRIEITETFTFDCSSIFNINRRCKRGILAHFENNLDFKSTSKSSLISKKTIFVHFENNLDFKATSL